jgi:peptidyl-prolyl cis-trans isomerase B (cyclophilin B)
MNKLVFISLFSLLTLATGCAQNKKDFVVTIKTKYGDMVAVLYDETPKHKENFLKLAREHYFDSTLFHRVIKDFMIQGGDPDSKKAKPGAPLGNGGPGYTIPAEFNPQFFHEKGALSAARLGDQVNPTKASSGSQFYIVQGKVIPTAEIDNLRYDQPKMGMGLRQMLQNPKNSGLMDTLRNLQAANDMDALQKKIFSLAPRIEKETGIIVTNNVSPEKIKAYTTIGGTPFLDGEYTVFGKVIKGLEVIDKIAGQPRDGADRPTDDIRMTVTVEELSRKKITKLYGYVYPEVKK